MFVSSPEHSFEGDDVMDPAESCLRVASRHQCCHLSADINCCHLANGLSDLDCWACIFGRGLLGLGGWPVRLIDRSTTEVTLTLNDWPLCRLACQQSVLNRNCCNTDVL